MRRRDLNLVESGDLKKVTNPDILKLDPRLFEPTKEKVRLPKSLFERISNYRKFNIFHSPTSWKHLLQLYKVLPSALTKKFARFENDVLAVSLRFLFQF